MINTELRILQNNLIAELNKSTAPMEAKRVILEMLALQCQIESNILIEQETKRIQEKGELDNAESVC